MNHQRTPAPTASQHPPSASRTCRAATLTLLCAALLAGCSSASGNGNATGTSTGTGTATVAANATTSADTSTSGRGGTYDSTSFVVPFEVTPPSWLPDPPAIGEPNFVTWTAPDLPALRFLVPVTIYLPGQSTTPTAPPTDYLTYLRGLTGYGAHFQDQVSTSVGGQPATLVTATTDNPLDGSLGCQTASTPAPDCFGLQPDLRLRIAVLKVHDKTLLVWLRTPTGPTTEATKKQESDFDAVLSSLRFSDRTPAPAPSSTPAATATAVDGNYVLSISWPKEKRTNPDARCMGGDEGAAPLTVYELSLDKGTIQLSVRIGGPEATLQDAFSGTYRVEKDQLIFGEIAGVPMSGTFRVSPRELTVSDLRGAPCGDKAIWTTKPWLRR